MFVVTSIYHDIFYLSFVLYLHLGVVNHLIVLVCHENVHVAETLESTDFIASYAQTTSEIFQKEKDAAPMYPAGVATRATVYDTCARVELWSFPEPLTSLREEGPRDPRCNPRSKELGIRVYASKSGDGLSQT